jgi:hypothetical protein
VGRASRRVALASRRLDQAISARPTTSQTSTLRNVAGASGISRSVLKIASAARASSSVITALTTTIFQGVEVELLAGVHETDAPTAKYQTPSAPSSNEPKHQPKPLSERHARCPPRPTQVNRSVAHSSDSASPVRSSTFHNKPRAYSTGRAQPFRCPPRSLSSGRTSSVSLRPQGQAIRTSTLSSVPVGFGHLPRRFHAHRRLFASAMKRGRHSTSPRSACRPASSPRRSR